MFKKLRTAIKIFISRRNELYAERCEDFIDRDVEFYPSQVGRLEAKIQTRFGTYFFLCNEWVHNKSKKPVSKAFAQRLDAVLIAHKYRGDHL